MSDLNPASNPGATYFAEAQYITPHEYAWCQAHPGQCNMYNNVSYRQFSVTGTTSLLFRRLVATVRKAASDQGLDRSDGQPVRAWPRESMASDSLAYKVTNPSAGVWHYEYAVYNQNLDRAIQSFSVPWDVESP